MDPVIVTDDVIDLIAGIEMHRQKIEKDSGLAAACNEALRQLHELLDREREALQARGPDARHSANIEAVTIEIKRVKKLLGNTRRDAISGVPRPGQVSLQSAARNFPRDKGRRTMGRGER
jgi:hypothetical protein